MDVADMLLDLGKMAKELKNPMTLEEAIDLVDPDPNTQAKVKASGKIPDSMAATNAMLMKAHMIVVEYARKQIERSTAKAPIEIEKTDGNISNAVCPVCGYRFPDIGGLNEFYDEVEQHDYCPNCGQKIDWEIE